MTGEEYFKNNKATYEKLVSDPKLLELIVAQCFNDGKLDARSKSTKTASKLVTDITADGAAQSEIFDKVTETFIENVSNVSTNGKLNIGFEKDLAPNVKDIIKAVYKLALANIVNELYQNKDAVDIIIKNYEDFIKR